MSLSTDNFARPAAIAALAATALFAASAVWAAWAPAAQASTATISGGNRVNVTAGGNERNQLRVAFDAGLNAYVVTDAVGVSPSGTCVAVDPNTVSCPAAAIASVTVNSGAANDTIALDRASWPATIEGDLDGGTGDDRVTSAGAADSVSGGSGRDVIDGGPGADDLRGGSSSDAVYYGDRTAPLIVTVGAKNDDDGDATDATGNSRDTVHGDVEAVIAGAANDIVIGDGSDENLFGGEGDDVLFGGRGKDTLGGANGADYLSGDQGDDLLHGDDGPDRTLGGEDSDRVKGGAGDDLVRGGPGVDVMKGKGGIDVLQARDGFTDRRINCGPGPNGREFAKRDHRLDPRAKSC